MRDRILKIAFSALLVLFPLLRMSASANAATPDDEPIKGTIPAASCVLEKAYFGDKDGGSGNAFYRTVL